MIEHDQLDEGTGLGRRFPLRGAFTGAQADDRATDADALTRFEGDVADEAVALVEQAEDGDPLLHRRDTSQGGIACGRQLGDRAGIGGRRRLIRLAVAGR